MKHVLVITVGLTGLLGLSAKVCAQEAAKKPTLIETLFDLKRSAKEDVIHFRNKDVLRGRVLNETVTIATQYGMLKVPLRRCAGLSFEGARANTEAVVTVNFNRITGIITDRVINFQITSSGTKIPIRKEKIRFLLLQRTANEADFIEKSPKADLFLMANGDLLSGEAVERKITIRTDYAKIPVSFAEMKDVKMQGGDNVTAVISKTNGDTMRGTLDTDEITLDLEIGIQVRAIYKDKFARVFVDQARKQSPVQFAIQRPVQGESDGIMPVASMRAGQKTLTLKLGKDVTMKLVLIPAGKFTMGSPATEKGRAKDEEQQEVTIAKAFYMGIHEVTQEQYEAVTGGNPSSFKGAKNPVESVSWDDATEFCRKLSTKTGKTVLLPTEAKWEYACRAGSKTRFCSGDDEKGLDAYGWHGNNSSNSTHRVGEKKPNNFGLYDMHGNVYEWCSDRYVMPGNPVTTFRVRRGGAWKRGQLYCRSANRDYQHHRNGFKWDGFRVVVLAGLD